MDMILTSNKDLKRVGRTESSSGSSSVFSRSFTRSSTTTSSSRPLSTERSSLSVDNALGLTLLYAPPEPLVDFVFVHGLGGHPKKTWTQSGQDGSFWPQDWLPHDEDFSGVRIHTFGYNANYSKGQQNCLSIHHFAKSLLAHISLSSDLQTSDTPLVMIAHSMGGLIVKKAYLLATGDDAHEGIARRLGAMFFLATPHRGSDSAKMLNDILQIASVSRLYIEDLEQGSSTLRSINDDFRRFAGDMKLWSFYETQKLSIGVFKKLIVDPDSAVLGFREEQQVPMNADHRSICKFVSPEDSNYQLLRNALASTVKLLSNNSNQGTGGDERDQLQAIRESIVVSQDPENDLISVQNSRFEGTCTWIVRKPSFVSWKYSTAARPTVFWIKGHPATGKSVLAGFAIDHLKSEGLLCSYFFFRHGDKLKSRSGDCLRSLAYQMACADPLVRKELVGLLNDGRRFDIDSDQVLWRKIFVNGILQRDLSRHCWVIDGLDECSNPTSFLNTILGKQDTASSLKVLVTSRESTELGRNFAALCPGHLTTQLVSPSETLGDIKSYATCKIQSFLEGSDAREALVEKVVEKSQGSFLWTVLVLEGLSTTYGEEEMKQVLEEVPLGMDALYSRTITTMSSMARGKKLATVILRWAVCCTRPLTINELETALSLELKDNFSRIKQSITSLCGQLVTVNNADQVLMIHETAREFLLDESLESEFAINRLSCHTSLARCCLDYLNSDEMKPPRSTRRQSSSARTKPRAEFSKYACSAFSYHLAKSDARANDLLKSVYTFLRGNVLSWIESIARSSSILLLVVTAKNLKTYFNACAIERSPLSRELQTVLGWTTDLIRIAAKFGDALVLAPSAIYSQVPAFCPQETFIHKAAPSSNIFSVLGLSQRTWDGRLANFEFHTGQASAIVYGGKHIAVGLASGTITVYHAMTFQKHLVLDHSEAVKYIAFTQSSDELVSCSMKSIRVWNLRTGNLTRSFSSPPNPMGMVIDGERLIVPARRNFIATWDLKHDCQREHDISWANSDESRSQNVLGVTSTVSISTGHKVLAAGYPDRDILLWDLEENTYMGSCGRQQVHPLQALVLNPNPSLDFLVASYLDGELFLIDPFRNETIARIHANCQTLAASADGRFLAGSPGSGFIQIYEFDTLRMIYRVQAGMYFVKQVTFSEDGFHLADIRGKQCNVWEPSVLLRAIQGDDSSEGTLGADVEAVSVESKNKITSMATNNSDDSIICGKDDGSVDVYNRHTGAWVKTLWKHKSRVSMLCWCCNSRRLISADDSNSIIAWEVQKSSTEGLLAVTQLFHQYIGVGGTVMQVLPRETSEAIIFASWMSDYLMTWEGEKLQEIQSQVEDTSGIHSWVQHPTSTEHAVRLDGRQIQLFTWKELKCIQTVHFDGYHAGQTLRGVFCYQSTADKEGLLLFELLGNRNSAAAPKLIIVDLMNMIGEEEVGAVSSQETTDSAPALGRLSLSVGPCRTLSCTFDRILRILDVDHGTGRVVYLDLQSWVCSAHINDLMKADVPAKRHFFVPYNWVSASSGAVSGVFTRDIVFGRNDELAVVRGGLDLSGG